MLWPPSVTSKKTQKKKTLTLNSNTEPEHASEIYVKTTTTRKHQLKTLMLFN